MRKIALSNLSILGTSLLKGPKAAWKVAQDAGFDALKINPLWRWEAQTILDAEIPVTAFEAPWRASFVESFEWGRTTGEWRAILMDPLLFGYDRAMERCRRYHSYFGTRGAIAVDSPWADFFLVARGLTSALETDHKKYPLERIQQEKKIVFDTWHMRGYAPHQPVFPGYKKEHVVAIDVQTRDIEEWYDFIDSQDCLLARQLKTLAETPETVSAALEIHPLQLKQLGLAFNRPPAYVLRRIRNNIRYYLN
jgi:hypothetical protein